MEEIDIKKVIIFLVLVIAIIGGIIFTVIKISSGNNSYTLEEIKEEDYKYYAVYTNRKIWSTK